MKQLNTELCSSLMSKLQNYRLDKLFIIFLLSLSIVSCGGNGSSNSVSDDCSDGFGDASRCETRENLQSP